MRGMRGMSGVTMRLAACIVRSEVSECCALVSYDAGYSALASATIFNDRDILVIVLLGDGYDLGADRQFSAAGLSNAYTTERDLLKPRI